jgi:hypothetical protein
MPDMERRRDRWAALAATALILTFGIGSFVDAADHLDTPTVQKIGAADLTDVYAFSTGDYTRTVLIANVNPGAGVLPNSGTTFGTGILYQIKVDTNGDARADVRYGLRFGAANASGVQSWTLTRNGATWTTGTTGTTRKLGLTGAVWAGLRDDPFFFDLAAFQGNVLGTGNGRLFCDAGKTDFFAGLNVSAIVLVVPNSEFGGRGKNIGVWATTSVMLDGDWHQIDAMGRPAINTVFNSTVKLDAATSKADKELFNRVAPREQIALSFRDNVIATLEALSALSGTPYTTAEAEALAKVLVPDMLTMTTGDRSGFLNGRRLRDDVIDTELGLVTKGAVPSDCIGNDSTFSSTFPYLAPPN